MKFSALPLAPELLGVLGEIGFEDMTPIQEAALPALLAGEDLIGESATGSGKTAAFVLPLLQKLMIDEREVQSLVLCPTRELSAQVAREFRRLGSRMPGLQIGILTGGASARDQVKSLQNGAQIIVGTPGRILDFLQKDRLDVSQLRALVLDEADKMLDMGFEAEMNAILELVPEYRQTLLFSATIPPSIRSLSARYQKNPVHVKIAGAPGSDEAPRIEQQVFDMGTDPKADLLMRVLQQQTPEAAVIFCNQKATVNDLVTRIREAGAVVGALHGDLEQRDRDRVLAMFRGGSLRLLVATDVAARGLDIDHLDLVVNYDFPTTPETYVHRIGRTGRAGRTGTAVTFVKADDGLRLAELEKAAGLGPMVRPKLGFRNQHGLGPAEFAAPMKTLWISGGRKDKLRPGDILGALTGKGANLPSGDVGKIEVHDHFTYVAVAAGRADEAFRALRDGRIKTQKFQVRIMKP